MAVIVGALGLSSPGAQAATVSGKGGNVSYTAARGETNRVTASDFVLLPSGTGENGFWLHETGNAKLVARDGCVVREKTYVLCDVGPDREFEASLTLHLGDQNDYFWDDRYQPGPVDVFGEAGDDELSAAMTDASAGAANVDGGVGNDNLYVGNGAGFIVGGPGDDAIGSYGGDFDAGPGNDTTWFSTDFGVSDTTLTLGPGNDSLAVGGGGFGTRRTAYGSFIEWGGDDTEIDGGTGVDTISFDPFAGPENALGFQFKPLMVDLSSPQFSSVEIVDQRGARPDGKGGALGTLLLGTDGYEVLRGGDGPDIIVPGRRGDWVSAGPGADQIITVDGAVDHISCGTGIDALRSDKVDVVWAKDCERSRVALP